MAKALSKQQRLDGETIALVNWIKGEHMKKGRPAPTTAQILNKITSKIIKEDLLKNEFIRF